MPKVIKLPHAALAARYQAGGCHSALVAGFAAEFACDVKTVRKSLRASGVYQARLYSAAEKAAIVADYNAGQTIQAIADRCCVNFATMHENLTNWGADIRRTGPARTHALDERFFADINTEEKAYWLGFLFADGNVGVSRRVVQIGLARKDREHLVRLATAIGYSGPLTDYICTARNGQQYPATHLGLGCAVMARDLIQLGCVPRKTYAERLVPPRLASWLLSHFYRGYFDGDGSLVKHPSQRSWSFEIIGHPEFVAAAQTWFCAHCALTPTKLITPRITKYAAVMRYQGTRQVRRILDLLYADANVYLARKYARALQVVPT